MYTTLETNGRCYFCENEIWANVYRPTKSEVRVQGPHGEMLCYRVCLKCYGRLVRRRSMSHDETMNYVRGLEERGSIRGRVKAHKGVTVYASNGSIVEINHVMFLGADVIVYLK